MIYGEHGPKSGVLTIFGFVMTLTFDLFTSKYNLSSLSVTARKL